MHLHSNVFSYLSLLYNPRDKQTPQRILEPLLLCFGDLWYIWVNQMSSWSSTPVAIGLETFLICCYWCFSLLCDTTVMPEGEIRAEVTIAVCRDLASCSRTLEEDTCSLLLRFEWSFRVKWENTWWLMCWVSFMTLEFLKEVETSLLSQRYMSAGEKISMTEQFFFFFLLLSMNNDTPQSHISLSPCAHQT